MCVPVLHSYKSFFVTISLFMHLSCYCFFPLFSHCYNCASIKLLRSTLLVVGAGPEGVGTGELNLPPLISHEVAWMRERCPPCPLTSKAVKRAGYGAHECWSFPSPAGAHGREGPAPCLGCTLKLTLLPREQVSWSCRPESRRSRCSHPFMSCGGMGEEICPPASTPCQLWQP